MDNFQQSLNKMKRACLQDFHGPEYWNVVLEEGETPLSSDSSATEISVSTKEGFIIKIRLMDRKPYMCNINGYLSLPHGLHFESWLKDNPSYDDLNDHLCNMKVELTYGSAKDLEYGWDHAHDYDANLGVPMAQQFQKKVSGPVQVLEEARFLIRSIMDKENEILQGKKNGCP
jgi:hypothetical protein